MQHTITRKVRLTATQLDRPAVEILRTTETYVRRAYGLLATDTVRVSLNRSTRLATVALTVSGPRRGSKWNLG